MHLAHRHRRAARRIVIKMAAMSRQVYLFSVRRSDIGPCADAFFSRPDPAPRPLSMCGRFTHRYTWAEIQRLYRLTSPASNVQPSYNVCPTDAVNVVTSSNDMRILQPMRWGLIPRWWSKPL